MTNVGQLGGQPILILPEGTLRSTGKDAQTRNIAAAKTVAESIRDRAKNLPIIAITNVPNTIDVRKHYAYDDVIDFSRDISQKGEYLKSISQGYRILNKKPPSNIDDLLKLMNN